MGVTFIAPAEQFTSPAVLISKEITEDGTYYAADDNANGYSSVEVSVGGGGGGGDFSTAEVTFNNEIAVFIGEGLTIQDNENGLLSIAGAVDENTAYPLTLPITLYKGKATCKWNGESGPTVTGSISFDNDTYTLVVTGNGSITFAD